MLKHETKACPRCGQVFECKVGDILKCQCYGISFTEKEQAQVANLYSGCLCRQCLLKLKEKFSK